MALIDLRAMLLLGPLVLGCGDPLVGTWVTHTYPGGPLPADVASYTEDLTFASDMSFEVSIESRIAMTARVYPGCAQTCALSGLTWATSSDNGKMTLAVSGRATETASRAGCEAAKDDMPARPATPSDCPVGMPGGNYTYTLENGTLTTSSASGGGVTYTLSGS
jgi:hypothetical protein